SEKKERGSRGLIRGAAGAARPHRLPPMRQRGRRMAEVMEHIDTAHAIESFPAKLAFTVVELERNIWVFHLLDSRIEHRLVCVTSDDATIRQSPGQRFGEVAAAA